MGLIAAFAVNVRHETYPKSMEVRRPPTAMPLEVWHNTQTQTQTQTSTQTSNSTQTQTQPRQVNPYPGLGEVGGPLVLNILFYYSQA